MPLVSVIVPVYNCAKYLQECVASIQAQTVKDLEIILVDDGSTDGSSKLCDRLAMLHGNVFAYHKENGGAASARNLGIDHAKGEWLMFVDADDNQETNIIEELLKQCKDDIDIAICCCRVLLGEESEVDCFFPSDLCMHSEDEKRDLYYQLMQLSHKQPNHAYTAVGVPWGKLYRRSMIETHAIRFPKELRRLQDNIFNMYAFHYARGIYYLNAPLYHYRFEHIQGMYAANRSTMDRTLKLLHARQQCLAKIGLSEDRDIQIYANCERIRGLVNILRLDVFHPKCGLPHEEQTKTALRLCEMPLFQGACERARLSDFHTAKERLYYVLVKHQRFRTFRAVLASHIKLKSLKEKRMNRTKIRGGVHH